MFLKFIQNKIARYLIAGGIAAFVSLSFLYVLTDIVGLWYLLSSTIAFVFAFFASFLLQKLWTFKNTHTHDISRQVALYLITALTGLAANALFMYVLVSVAGLWYMLAQVFSSGAIAVVTFFIYGNIIFNHTQKGRVLLATPLYPPDIGGPATYAKLLETELPSRNIHITIVSFSSVRKLPKIIRHLVYFLIICFRATEAEIIYALDPVSVGFPALIVSKLLRKKFLLRIAGDYAWEQYQVQNEKRKMKNTDGKFITPEEFQERKFDFVTEARRKIEHLVARNAGHIVVPSEYLKKIVQQWGIEGLKIKVIYNSFEFSASLAPKENVREKLGMHGTVIFSAGRLVPWKGFSALIDVIAELKKEIPDIKLYIAGDGPERETLKLQVTSYKLQDVVFLVGRLSSGMLTEYIRAADIFVLNTGYEGFSHQLLEVMALGTPIITTNIGGNSELIENQKEGLLVSYNDKSEIKNAVKTLLKNGAMRNDLIKNGIEKAKSFSKEKAIESLVTLL
ncbi:MAG: glycosyltransferase [Parcubacteria group bacterium]|nr:glycosyltransferase [Parcubacteria group bacterium]